MDKFEANRSRDERNVRSLLESGWRVLSVWECALKGKLALPPTSIVEVIKAWLNSTECIGDIAGSRFNRPEA
jgi:DNA mismatch endonuclease (patch repair protein)